MSSMNQNQSQVMAILYEVKDADTKEVIDSNLESKPLEFLLGAGQVISGLEKAVAGAKKGDKLNITIAPEDAYGVYQADFLQEVPKDQFEGIALEKGMTLFGQAEDGQTVQVLVKDIGDSSVMIDYNHPLAGKTLAFDIEITDVRDATPDEILRGGVGGCSGGCGCGGHDEHAHDHDHGGGGCCGGGGGGCGCH
ncbi:MULTISPECIES: FKBP-type peptidyl-prolyl cis-trans isomerase [unclassified Helicobacter]|uniref:FKBP-type peptidyl-prolyl cis-trans isomerase n=1 Tax=unclassified Helicobacter TaxID=2593540 RepID=UPI0009ED273B|nr:MULTISPECIES: peptidylprolyl isomerase [unclassified Helicobacter]